MPYRVFITDFSYGCSISLFFRSYGAFSEFSEQVFRLLLFAYATNAYDFMMAYTEIELLAKSGLIILFVDFSPHPWFSLWESCPEGTERAHCTNSPHSPTAPILPTGSFRSTAPIPLANRIPMRSVMGWIHGSMGIFGFLNRQENSIVVSFG